MLQQFPWQMDVKHRNRALLDPARKRDWQSENLHQKIKQRPLQKKSINNTSEKAESFPKYFQNILMKKASQHVRLTMMTKF